MLKRLSKIFICLFLSIITLFGCSSSMPEDYSKYLTFERISETECSVKLNENGYIASKIVIPNKYEGFDITSISSHGFEDAIYLEEIVIPNSVTYIGYHAFYGCSSLTIYCEVESEPSGWDSYWNPSDRPVYWGVTLEDIKDIIEQNGIRYLIINGEAIVIGYVGNDAQVVIPLTIKVGWFTYYSVTSIGDSAFQDCGSLTSIVIPDSVTSIGYSAFYDCDSLTSVTIGDSATSIGDFAFGDCDSLTSVTIGDSVTSIGSYAFSECSSLTSIVIPESVTTIGSRAFYDCTSLTSITLPFVGEKVDGSGETHFGYIFGASSYFENDHYVPTSLKEVIITGGNSIGDSAFYKCSSLTSIVIPNSVTSIGEEVFKGCSSLTSIVIPNSVTSIGSRSFSECRSLTSVTIGDSVTSIGSYTFEYCYSLTSIVIPDSVTTIGYSAFYDCYSLRSVTIGDSVTSIGSSAFEGCRSLTSIVIPDSVTSIGSRAFYDCTSLTSIVIPDSVTSIGGYAFLGCRSLTIYCEVESQPSGWDSDWNYSNRPVVWGWKE